MMDFQSAMETFAEVWVAANTQTPLTEAADEAQNLLANQTSISTTHTSGSSVVLQDLSERQDQLRESSENRGSSILHSPPSSTGFGDFRSVQQCRMAMHGSGKALPLHCVVEKGPTHHRNSSLQLSVELDSYAIVPTSTLFTELIRIALTKLGYSASEATSAKGAIQLKNWKPLSFEQITDTSDATVGDILGDLGAVATLRIRLCRLKEHLKQSSVPVHGVLALLPQQTRPRSSLGWELHRYKAASDFNLWTYETVRNAVLELLREMAQVNLAKICPLPQPVLSNIVNNKTKMKIGREKCKEFGRWYIGFRRQNPDISGLHTKNSTRPYEGRMTFHSSKEQPVMREWYQACKSPSEKTLQIYTDILNETILRQQERPKITLTNLKNWWKNERQRERKRRGIKCRTRSKQIKNQEVTSQAPEPHPITVDTRSQIVEVQQNTNFNLT